MAAISFARGVPSSDILPVDLFGDCARSIVERDGRTVLNYGPPGGYPPLRELIAERHGTDPGRVVVTNGSLQAFTLVTQLLFRSGGRAIVEAPTYDRTAKTLRRVGAELEAVPMLEDGLDVDVFADLIATGPAPALLYTIPTFQNPSGRSLSLSSRERLAALISEHRLMVYEDDPYYLVRFEGDELPTLFDIADSGTIIYASSFSKTIAPGLRVGYVLLPEDLVEPVQALATDTYLSPAIFVQGALFEFLRRGHFEANVARTCKELRSRRDAMLESLEAGFPPGCSWNRPEGGYFLWLDLPPGVGCADLLARATERGITFVRGTDFFVDEGGEESLRLAFSFPSVVEIREGIAALGALVGSAVNGA